MQWLVALLAFATTMLIFSMVVSVFVEMVHRIFRMRSGGMKLLLQNLYIKYIEPRLGEGEKPSPQEFALIIMENRALAVQGPQDRPGIVTRFIRWLVDSSVMTDIPAEVFTQKLVDNRIISNLDAFSDVVVKDIAQKYESLGQEISTYFERRARLISVAVALVVAWCFYVHPYNLMVAYLSDPELAAQVAAQSEKTYGEYTALAERLEEIRADGAQGTADEQAFQRAVNELREEIAKATQTSEKLAAARVPVGWPPSSARLWICGAVPPANQGSDDGTSAQCWASISWFSTSWSLPVPGYLNALWLIAGGLLVGLGAPFWARAVASLSTTRDITRRITNIVSPAHAPSQGGLLFNAKGLNLTAHAPPVALRTFEVAREAGSADLVTKKVQADDGRDD